MRTLAMLHTGPVVIKPLNDIAKAELAGVRIVNFMDDSIVAEIERSGEITQAVRNRLEALGRNAVEAGADAILITCSSISTTAAAVAESIGLPVYKIDEAMAEAAVAKGTNIGVVATLPTTLEPTCAQIEDKARAAGKTVNVRRALCREAFESLSRGDENGHDRILLETVEKLSRECDVVVLAQASMARLVDSLPPLPVPVLSSPQLGIERVRDELAKAASPA